MKSSVMISVLRIFLGILSAIFLALSAALFFSTVWLFSAYSHYEDIRNAKFALIPTTAIFGLAVILLVVGLTAAFTCCCCYNNKCLPSTLAIFLFLLLGLELTACVLAYKYKSALESEVKRELVDAFQHYSNVSDLYDEINFVQTKLKCCGIYNYSDWSETPWYKAIKEADPSSDRVVPSSCCVKAYECSGSLEEPTTYYHKGCFTRFKNVFSNNLIYIAEVAVAFFVIQLLGVVFSLILLCQKKEVSHSYRVLNHDMDYTI
ncbi:unnamed protein product [Gordionus sp. m RMFG-2023]|uniref:tetraspanin-3-like n=1 Tax=Gordionus sp. m RMFG-2023 TaxID=3053472 RepID=UPI0030E0DB97